MANKKYWTLYFVLFFTISLNSQNRLKPENQRTILKTETKQHMDPQANFLYERLISNSDLQLISNSFHTISDGNQLYIPALIKVKKSFNFQNLKKINALTNSQIGQILSVWIPVKHFIQASELDGIEYLELARKTHGKLERALASSKVNLVHEGNNLSQNYTGKDVVIGILDLGFDYTHPAFRDADGNLRIKKSWEQNINRNPPEGYNYGNNILGDDLFNELFDASDIGHGIHVANVAAGSDYVLDGKYNGVAYESDLVFVSLLQLAGLEGLNTGVIDGINYVFDHAQSVGKPAVVNLSQGHHMGPHDGTSLADQAIDALSGPGRVVVGAVGNEGDPDGFYLHFDHTFDVENTVVTNIAWQQLINGGETTVDIWGEQGSDFSVTIELHNPRTKTTEAISMAFNSAEPNTMLQGQLIDAESDTLTFQGIVEINPLNDRPHISLHIDNTGQVEDLDENDLLNNDFIQLRFNGSSGQVHAYSANNLLEAFFTDLSGIGADEFIENVRVQGGNPNYTIGELGGTSQRIISVGGYMVNNTIVNTAGETLGTDEVVGDFYFRSSRGPTHDGRMKPDISAPAGWIVAAENSFNSLIDPQLSVDTVAKGDQGSWSFTARRGTSFSSPMVAGIVALMLEINPSLTPEEIKEMLQTLSDQDEFTGTVPNNLWGHGKVNAHNLITALEVVTSDHNFNKPDLVIKPNPSAGIVRIENDIAGTVNVRIFNAAGKLIIKTVDQIDNRSLDLTSLDNGIYFIELESSKGMHQGKIIIAK